MRFCTSCGHQLGVGRFCTNCGLRVDAPAAGHEEWRTDTAERPAVPAEPAPVRFPLYADQVAEPAADPVADPVADPEAAPVPEGVADPAVGPVGGTDDVTSEPGAPETAAVTEPETTTTEVDEARAVSLLPMTETTSKGAVWPSTPRGRRAAYVVIGVVVVWALAAVFGAVLLLRGNDASDSAKDTTTTPASPKPARTTEPAVPPTDVEPPSPTDVAGLAAARAPSTSPPGQDLEGNEVTYGAARMLDHDHTTCWRMDGDGTGRTVIFTLRRSTVISRVGLVNGYAKSVTDAYGNTFDYYAGDRRILSVQWEFDDGTTVEQDLRDDHPLMQRLKIKPVRTSTVRLKVLSVSDPGSGNTYSDNTAISEISLIGVPAA